MSTTSTQTKVTPTSILPKDTTMSYLLINSIVDLKINKLYHYDNNLIKILKETVDADYNARHARHLEIWFNSQKILKYCRNGKYKYVSRRAYCKEVLNTGSDFKSLFQDHINHFVKYFKPNPQCVINDYNHAYFNRMYEIIKKVFNNTMYALEMDYSYNLDDEYRRGYNLHSCIFYGCCKNMCYCSVICE